MSCAHSGHRLDCPKVVHLAVSASSRGENGARTRPDHQTFEAELVRTGRDERAVDDGLQADRTLLVVDLSFCELIAFCEFAGHRRRRRRFRHVKRDDRT